jgi:arylsulfatase A-like enzyme/cytochrome c-type biogenesis protein CcmH/NrfG
MLVQLLMELFPMLALWGHRARRNWAVSLCVPAVLGLSACQSDTTRSATAPAAVQLKPLNVVLITVDTLRADRLHAYGYDKVSTPVLDRLAREGALFENAFAQSPLTPPSHASIFTGTYPTVHHVRNTGGFVLQSSSRTLASILEEQGWDTAAFVGASVLKKAFGFSQGFRVYDDQMPKAEKKDEFGEYPERRAGMVVDRALTWLDAQSGKPFFVWLHVYDPHKPYDPPEPFRRIYQRNPYDGEVAYTDQELGRFLEAVEKKSPAERTLTIVLADHGESLGEHGEYTHGVFIYDSTLRIPLIMRGAGIPPGVRIKQQVRTIDVLPTVLAAMGGQPPPASQGVSFLPAFSGKQVPPVASYAETLYPKMNMGWAELRGIRTDRWKYIRAPKPELYDVAQDPAETNNVIDRFPNEYHALEKELRAITNISEDRPEKVGTSTVDQRTMAQLKTLGYLSDFTGRQYELTGKGVDPKDRTDVLRVYEAIEDPRAKMSSLQRIKMLESARASDDGNPSTYYYLGGELEKASRYDDAMKLYQTAISKGVENGKLYSRLGDLYLRSGRRDEAIPYYEKAARYNPSDVESHSNLATAYLELGRVAEAERVFQFITTVDEYAPAYNGLGLISIQRGNPAGARGFFEKAVQLDPDLVEAHMNLGLIYEMIGDRTRARAAFQAFLAKASPRQYGHIIPKVRKELAALR